MCNIFASNDGHGHVHAKLFSDFRAHSTEMGSRELVPEVFALFFFFFCTI